MSLTQPGNPDVGPATASRPLVLVVEDDPDLRQILILSLASVGFAVEGAPDGAAGLEAARRLAPDVVVLDGGLPELDGPEVCRRLRRDPATAEVPIIMVTGRSGADDVERGFAAGADDYVVKPFGPEQLVARIDAVLARAGDPAGVRARP
jgi:DNA-binding response OmpR family regulator